MCGTVFIFSGWELVFASTSSTSNTGSQYKNDVL